MLHHAGKIATAIALAIVCGTAFAAWEFARLSEQQPAGASVKCIYKTSAGAEFSFTEKSGICPRSVRVDLATGDVEK